MKAFMHILDTITDFCFPPSQSLTLVRTTPPTDILTYYKPQVHQTVTTLTEYPEPVIKAIITAAKFEHNEQVLRLLAPMLNRYITEFGLPVSTTAFVPIPLHPKRKRERGYNQVASLLSFANQLSIEPLLIVNALVRNRHTEAQSHLGKAERTKNIAHAFSLNPRTRPLTGITDIVILDDVVTTGSTLKCAADTLRKHTASHITIHQVAIARAY